MTVTLKGGFVWMNPNACTGVAWCDGKSFKFSAVDFVSGHLGTPVLGLICAAYRPKCSPT